MKTILLRADDLGYSEAINYGIEKSVKEGLIRSVGVMVNMPATQHGVDLLKGTDIAFGLHTNICAEKPLTDASLVPSLVDDKGYFHSSKVFRSVKEDVVNLDEVILEIEAQYHRFVQLFGRKPDYFEGHAIASPNFFKGLEYVADKYQLKYSPFAMDSKLLIGHTKVQVFMDSMKKDYAPLKTLTDMVQQIDSETVGMMVNHPGYLDEYILRHSSLTIPRTQEVTMLTSQYTKEWLENYHVQQIDYRDL